MKRRFKAEQQEKVYQTMIHRPPVFYNHQHKWARLTGSILYERFWQGYDGVQLRQNRLHTTYAAYAAGREYRTSTQKNRLLSERSLNNG